MYCQITSMIRNDRIVINARESLLLQTTGETIEDQFQNFHTYYM